MCCSTSLLLILTARAELSLPVACGESTLAPAASPLAPPTLLEVFCKLAIMLSYDTYEASVVVVVVVIVIVVVL